MSESKGTNDAANPERDALLLVLQRHETEVADAIQDFEKTATRHGLLFGMFAMHIVIDKMQCRAATEVSDVAALMQAMQPLARDFRAVLQRRIDEITHE